MVKIRWLVTLSTTLFVVTFVIIFSYYARGYRLNRENLTVEPRGILVLKSVPDSAQIYIDGEFKSATDDTLRLPPGYYDLRIEKEGYIPWSNRILIEKEAVNEITAHLFRSAPSLSAVTFSPSVNPVPAYDMTKIAFAVPASTTSSNNSQQQGGLYVMEMINLPLGFSRDPRRITDGDVTGAEYVWSPDGREILLTTQTGAFLLDTGEFTSQQQRINIGSERKEELLAEWLEERLDKLDNRIDNLPVPLHDLLLRKSSEVIFSPDEEMVLYTASGSATLEENLKKPLPGSSSQKQQRDIEPNRTYIYDIEEDRNYLIDDSSDDLTILGGTPTHHIRRLSWFPTSRHVILAEPNHITIMDYDGTNRKEVYSGIYMAPHAYPAVSLDRILILTNLGANSNPTYLYSLGLR